MGGDVGVHPDARPRGSVPPLPGRARRWRLAGLEGKEGPGPQRQERVQHEARPSRQKSKVMSPEAGLPGVTQGSLNGRHKKGRKSQHTRSPEKTRNNSGTSPRSRSFHETAVKYRGPPEEPHPGALVRRGGARFSAILKNDQYLTFTGRCQKQLQRVRQAV